MSVLIVTIGVSAFADLDCSRIRQCPTSIQTYNAKVGLCVAERTSNNCREFARDPELKARLRPCTLESECEEKQTWLATEDFIPGCTGLTKEKRQGIVDWATDVYQGTARGAQVCRQIGAGQCAAQMGSGMAVALFNIGWAIDKEIGNAFVAAHDIGQTVGNGDVHPVKWWNDKQRRWACFDNTYKYKMMCEAGGGVFKLALVAGAVRQGIADAAIETMGKKRVAALGTRASTAEAKETLRRARAIPPPSSLRLPAPKAVAGAAAAVEATRAVAKPLAVNEVRQKEIDREEYLKRLLGHQNTTAAERRAFSELAMKTRAQAGTVYLDLQNSKLKYLNDHLGDKNLVTSLTNLRLKMAIEDFNGLKAKYPNLETLKYDDFKSFRLQFHFKDGVVPPGFLDDVKRVMAESETRYINELADKNLVPRDSEILPPEKWFSTGIGRTGDQANAGARRSGGSGSRVVNFSDPLVRSNFQGRLTQTEIARTGTMSTLKKTLLVERLPDGNLIPSTEVFEAYRKSTTPQELARLIEERTGEKITGMQAQKLREYLKGLDEWSTSLMIVEDRQSVSFAGSKYNGATIDVSGMGALNMRELAKSLVGEKDVDRALVRSRESERAATAIFERNKAAIEKAARDSLSEIGIQVEVRVTGDDIIVLPLNRELDAQALARMQDAVARSPSSSNVRISAVGAGAARADQVAVNGELMEKKVRGLTLRSVPDQARYTLMVVTEKDGTSHLSVSARSGQVSDEARTYFEDAFRQAAEK